MKGPSMIISLPSCKRLSPATQTLYEFRLIGFIEKLVKLRVASFSENEARQVFKRCYGVDPAQVVIPATYPVVDRES